MTNKELLAAMLDGREYGEVIDGEIRVLARKSGHVIVHGASDDLMEFEGAWTDELDVYCGGTAYLTPTGLFKSACEDEDCPYAKKEQAQCRTIQAVYGESGGPAWQYITDIPHATFQIMEDGEVYCEGIVFSVEDLKNV